MNPQPRRRIPASRPPGYYAVIPAAVLFDAELLPWARLIYGAVAAMAAKSGEAWPTNKHLADVFGLSTDAVSRLIASLIERGHLTARYEKSEGNTRYLSLIKPAPADAAKAPPLSAQKPRGGIGSKADRGTGSKAATLSAQEPFPYKVENTKNEKKSSGDDDLGNIHNRKKPEAAGAASSPPTARASLRIKTEQDLRELLRSLSQRHIAEAKKLPEKNATPAQRGIRAGLIEGARIFQTYADDPQARPAMAVLRDDIDAAERELPLALKLARGGSAGSSP